MSGAGLHITCLCNQLCPQHNGIYNKSPLRQYSTVEQKQYYSGNYKHKGFLILSFFNRLTTAVNGVLNDFETFADRCNVYLMP